MDCLMLDGWKPEEYVEGYLQLYNKAHWDDETPEPEQVVAPIPSLEPITRSSNESSPER